VRAKRQRRVRRATRPSGHNIKPSFGKVDSGGSIPPNILEPAPSTDLLKFGNNAAWRKKGSGHLAAGGSQPSPARFM